MKRLLADLRSIDRRAGLALVFATAMLVTVQFRGKSDYWAQTDFARVTVPEFLEEHFEHEEAVGFHRARRNLDQQQFGTQMIWATVTFACFGVLPFLFAVLVLRMKPREFGFSLRGFSRHVWIYLAMYAVMLPFVLWASKQPSFLATYPFARLARTHDDYFLCWEIAYFLQFCALEMFFRGFMIFALEKRFGLNAIFVMTVPYTMIHYSKPMPEAFAAIIAGLGMGYMALRTRSFYGGILLHYGVALRMDMLARSQQ